MKNLKEVISIETVVVGLFGFQVIMLICLCLLLHRVILLESIHEQPALIKE